MGKWPFKPPFWLPEIIQEWIEGKLTTFQLAAKQSTDYESLVHLPVFTDKQHDVLVDHLSTHFKHAEEVALGLELDVEAYVEATMEVPSPTEVRKWKRRYTSLADRWKAKTDTLCEHKSGMYARIKELADSFDGTGRPEKTARDRLILAIKDTYGNPPITRHNHFEKTVEIILTFVEGSPVDVHGTILTARERDHDPFRND